LADSWKMVTVTGEWEIIAGWQMHFGLRDKARIRLY